VAIILYAGAAAGVAGMHSFLCLGQSCSNGILRTKGGGVREASYALKVLWTAVPRELTTTTPHCSRPAADNTGMLDKRYGVHDKWLTVQSVIVGSENRKRSTLNHIEPVVQNGKEGWKRIRDSRVVGICGRRNRDQEAVHQAQ
jgi:hypothetical protein